VEFYAFDAPYLEKLQSGDPRTEEHFVRYFRELIQLKLRSRLNSKEAIEDVEQETFVRVFAALRSEKGLRQAERLGAYVNSVCNNVLLEHYRGQRRTQPVEDDDPAAVLVEPGPDAFDLLMNKDRERAVREILDKLSDRDRTLLRHVILEERDKDEVCREFGVDRQYLRVLLHRAKQSFKSCFINEWPPAGLSVNDSVGNP
jgi:RNA polymerase sigma-70 factor, ECF subfamily